MKDRIKLSKRLRVLLAFIAVLPVFSFAQVTDSKYKTEQINMTHFHLIDFVGWNTSWDVLANYHSPDVKVFGDGWQTTGMKQHTAMLEPGAKEMTDVKIAQHSPNVAKGEWTGVVGISFPGKSKMATVARWNKGRIAEEYLFMRMLPADSASMFNPSAKAICNFTSPNDKTLALSVDVQPGWSCAMEVINGKRTAIFIKKENGKETERLVFQ
jgi:hypothetical protein